MKLLIILLIDLGLAGLTLLWLTLAFKSQRLREYVISSDPQREVDDQKLHRAVAINGVVSVVLIFGSTFGFYRFLFYEGATPLWKMLCEGVAVILIYDFAYYFMHRYPFHEWKVLRGVHSIHHAARYPRAIDSFLLHPFETFAGLALLLGSIAAIGGIHLYTFAPIFAAYTMMNILNHAGLNISHFPFKTLGVLAVKHDKHHHSMLAGNYASITPLPDMIFGTVE